MIPIASGVRVWIATGYTDMRRGMNSLALLVQEAFRRDPHGGDLYVFRGKSGKLIKILWHDGLGMSLYAKRLEHGRFLWPSSADGVVTIKAINYCLSRWDAFTRFLDDGRLCMSNNAAERELRAVAVGRRNVSA